MYRSYFISALRNFAKNKFNSLLNIAGLTVGVLVCLFILSYVFYESSYDKFLPDSDRIYRMVGKYHFNGRESESPYTVGKVGPKAINEIPGIETMFRIHHYAGTELEYLNFKTSNYSIAFVDEGVFDVLHLPFKSGIPASALTERNSAVITSQTAKALFGDDDPYEKIIEIDGRSFKVTGVLEDLPANFHLNVYDIFTSMSSVITPEYNIVELEGTHFPTYFLLSEGVNVKEIEDKINVLASQLVEEKFAGYGIEVDYYLQSLTDIHLSGGLSYDYAENINISYLYLFSVLAIFIILIAVVNFVNLTTAVYERRSKEVGIRKVTGARRHDLIIQFISESILLSLISFVFALMLVEVFSTSFTDLIGSKIPIIYYQTPGLISIIILFIIIIGFVSGIYPAFYLSGVKPIKAIKGGRQSNLKTVNLRKILVVFQFSISIFIIITLILLQNQMNFVKNKELGFEKKNVIVLQNLTQELRASYPSLKVELLQIPEVISITASQSVPGKSRVSNDVVYKADESSETGVLFNINRVQHDYISTFGIELINGHDFSKDHGLDSSAVILNEFGADKLGFDNPIGKRVKIDNYSFTIIGIAKDYNFNSLHTSISPVMLNMQSDWYRYISIKTTAVEVKELSEKIKIILKKADPNYVLDYYDVGSSFKQMYEAEDRMFSLFTYASVIAIIISILGLYALTAFTMQSKFKEIGIRKTLGASVPSITTSLIKNLTIWVIIANLIAWPTAYYFMSEWLLKFDYRINLIDHWWVFVIGSCIIYVFAFFTVFFQSRKAANTNPIESLKYE